MQGVYTINIKNIFKDSAPDNWIKFFGFQENIGLKTITSVEIHSLLERKFENLYIIGLCLYQLHVNVQRKSYCFN